MMTEDILRQLGGNIRHIREEKGIQQQNLAAMCNFETSVMSRIEAGGSNFTIGTLNKIAAALNVPITELF